MIEQDILKMGITELYERNKIDSTTKNSMDDYVENLSKYNVLEVEYSDFNSDDSTGVTFNASSRTITWDTGTAALLTNELDLANVTIKSLKIKATDEDVTWYFSTNGSTWYLLSTSYDLDEHITDGFYLKCTFTSTNTIKGIVVVYEID